MIRSVVTGVGSSLPGKILDNQALSEMVDTNDAWITERTGIKQRHIASEGETTATLAHQAAEKALQAASCDAKSIDLIVLATATPDNTFPSTASKVQALLGMEKGAAFDVQAVCAGFIYALATADNFLRTGQYKKALVIGADTLSRIVDWNDRNTCILFGDGAGALVLEASEDSSRGVLSTHLHSDGRDRDLLYVDGGPSTTGTAGVIHMQGREVFKHAVQRMADSTLQALDTCQLTTDDIDWVVPHQANQRILDATAKRLNSPKNKLVSTVAQHANTSAASIPLALDVASRDGRIQADHLVALQAIGGGLAWGSALIRW